MPLADCAPCGIASGSDIAEPGIFHTIQCNKSSLPSPIATSASRTINTKLRVESGAPLHDNAGDTSRPVCAYRAGIMPPSTKAGEESVMTRMPARRAFAAAGAAVGAVAGRVCAVRSPTSATVSTARSVSRRVTSMTLVVSYAMCRSDCAVFSPDSDFLRGELRSVRVDQVV